MHGQPPRHRQGRVRHHRDARRDDVEQHDRVGAQVPGAASVRRLGGRAGRAGGGGHAADSVSERGPTGDRPRRRAAPTADAAAPTMNDSRATTPTTPPATRSAATPARSPPVDPYEQPRVQQHERAVVAPVVGQPHPKDGGQDHRRVAEHHRHGEAEEHRVHDGVVGTALHDRPAHQPQHGGRRHPRVAGEQADRHVPGEPEGAHGVPGDVVPHEPGGQRQQPDRQHAHARVGRDEREQRAGEQQRRPRQHGRSVVAPEQRHPRELEPLPCDGEDDEGRQPRHERRQVGPPQPDDGRGPPGDGAERLDHQVQSRLSLQHHDVRGGQPGAGGREGQGAHGRR